MFFGYFRLHIEFFLVFEKAHTECFSNTTRRDYFRKSFVRVIIVYAVMVIALECFLSMSKISRNVIF